MPHMDVEDDAGGFRDNHQNPTKNIYDAEENLQAFRTQLLNSKDVSFLGPIFIGTPFSQGAMVVYDTGSDWLTVKACLTDQHCNKKIDKKATMAKHGPNVKEEDLPDDDDLQLHQQFNSSSVFIDYAAESLATVEEGRKPDKDGEKTKKKKKLEPVRTVDSVYSANKSVSGGTANNIAFPLSYGSADL